MLLTAINVKWQRAQDSDRSQAPLKDSGGVAVISVITANTLNPWLYI